MPPPAVLFPLVDPVGPSHPTRLAELVSAIVGDATTTDGVSRSTIDALASHGLLGSGLDEAAQRETAELIAGCDAATWFCWVQHRSPMRVLEGAVAGLITGAPVELRDRWLPHLQSGACLAAVAFAHVRRPGPPDPVATRVPGGWRLDGRLDWVTSWDIADVVMVMAQGSGDDADRLVCAFLPAGRTGQRVAGLVPGPTLDLLAMSRTHTRPLALDGVVVPDASVGAIVDRTAWLAQDALRTCDANPAAFGVARGAIAELAWLARERGDATLEALAHLLTVQCRDVREHAYRAADEQAPPRERLELRARSLDLVMRATTAAVVARSGGAMLEGSAAGRRAREALFLQVQAQTAATRDAALARMLVSGGES